MMTLRQRVWIIASIVIALILVIGFGILYITNNSGEEGGDPQGTQNVQNPGTNNQQAGGANQDLSRVRPSTSPTPVFSTEAQPERLARQIAGIFVERFQSYSSTNDQSNISRVEDFVTTRMWQWVETQAPEQSEEYSGVTTEVIASRIIEISEQEALVEVDVQQQIGSVGAVDLEQRSARVELIADGNGGWLVDGFFWQE